MKRTNLIAETFDPGFMARLESLSFQTRRVFSSTAAGGTRSSRPGTGVEFFDLRDYSPGDDARYVDWNAFARLDRPLLKLFHEEGEICVHVLVDASASMDFGSPSKFLYAAQVAAALSYVALVNGDRASVSVLNSGGCRGLPLLRGRNQIFRVFRFLDAEAPSGKTALAESLKKFAASKPRAGQVVLVSDLMDEADFTLALEYLRYMRFEPQVIRLWTPEELNPPYRIGANLSDSETGEETPVTDIEAYERERDEFMRSQTTSCVRMGVSLHHTATDTPLEDLVLRHLRKSGFYDRRRSPISVT